MQLNIIAKQEHIYIFGKVEDDHYLLNIQDTGLGISEEESKHVFETFYRASDGSDDRIEGSGLGLAIVHSIIQQHKGEIRIESVLGEGTTFFIRLPLKTETI